MSQPRSVRSQKVHTMVPLSRDLPRWCCLPVDLPSSPLWSLVRSILKHHVKSPLLSSIDMLCYLQFQLFDPRAKDRCQIWKKLAVKVCTIVDGEKRPINQWLLPTRREHSSHLSAGISGLVTSRANLLQRSVTLNPPVVLSTCPWMSAGIGRMLGRPIGVTMAEDIPVNGDGVSGPGRQPWELLPFTVDTDLNPSTTETRSNLNCWVIKGTFVWILRCHSGRELDAIT